MCRLQLRLFLSISLWLLGNGFVLAQQERVALLVGVNEYPKPGFSKLRFAERDVELAEVEFKNLGFKTVVLKGSLPTSSPMRATRANIVEQIEGLMEELDGDDICVVMLSGHGHQFRPTGAADEDAFFCPVDSVKNDAESMLSLNYVIDTLLDPHVGHKILLVDACRDEPKLITGNKGIQGSDKISLPSNTAVFFSCSAGKQSYETDKLGGGAGVFSYCLLDGLRGGAADSQGQLTWSRLVAHVEDRMESEEVRRATLRQQPLMAGNAGRVVLGKLPPKPVPNEPPPNVLRLHKGGIDLRRLPAGTFVMGSNESADKLLRAGLGGNYDPADEKPVRTIVFSRDVYLGITEVTYGQFKQFVNATAYVTESERDGNGAGGFIENRNMPTNYSWKYTGFAMDESHPVVNVTWGDANEFCSWLSKREGLTIRLPTEAEWEYACRAGTTTRFSTGDLPDSLRGYANVFDHSLLQKLVKAGAPIGASFNFDDNWPFTSPVKSFKSNAWDLYDMHGNVAEWCGDWYSSRYDLAETVDPKGPPTGNERVARGPSYLFSPAGLRCTSRGSFKPSYRLMSLGFRIACEDPNPANERR